MSIQLLSILPSFILSLITIHALCSMLVMRSPLFFAALFFVGYVLDIVCVLYELPTLTRVALVNPLIHIVLPIAMSVGPLRARVIRTGVVWLMDPIAELTGFAVVAALGLNPFQLAIDASSLPGLIMMYVTALLFYALACELVIRFFRRREGRSDTGIAATVLVFLLINTFFCYGLLTRMYGDPHTSENPYISGMQVLTLVASSFAGIVFGLLALIVAQRDIASSRTLANDQARMRQTRHVTQRIIETTDKRQDLARLRHDLANQVEVISELAETGHTDEAQAYLSFLQEEALRLEGDRRD